MDNAQQPDSPVILVSKDTLSQYELPNSEESIEAQKLLNRLIEHGVQHYISNVETTLSFIVVDSLLIPITVNKTEYENAYLTSNYHTLAEQYARSSRLLKPFLYLLNGCLKALKINQVVMVNNWLVPNNVYPNLTESNIKKIKAFLIKEYPNHLIMYRSVNNADGQKILDSLQRLGHRILYRRKIFYRQKETKCEGRVGYHRRRDERTEKKEGFLVKDCDDYKNILRLYNQLYCDKHTPYSPYYTEDYFKEAKEQGYLNIKGLYQDDKLLGFFAYHIRHGVMNVPAIGYDLSSPKKLKIYQVLLMHIIKESELKQVALNDGSGGQRAKMMRGLKPYDEYVLIYSQHLKWMRRFFWVISCACVSLRRFLRFT